MEIEITQDVIDTVCNSLRASRWSLRQQVAKADPGSNEEEIRKHQLADVEHALEVFQALES